MVALRNNEVVSVPIEEASQKSKTVDPKGQLVTTARAIGVRFGDELATGSDQAGDRK